MARLNVLKLQGKVLLSNHENIGTHWFEMLYQAKIGFVIRLRKGNYQCAIEQKGKSVVRLEDQARCRVGQVVWKKFTLQGYTYYYMLRSYRS
ncbi:MAG: hypothetical protein AAGE93_04410 [Bacteroidota bacterium]